MEILPSPTFTQKWIYVSTNVIGISVEMDLQIKKVHFECCKTFGVKAVILLKWDLILSPLNYSIWEIGIT